MSFRAAPPRSLEDLLDIYAIQQLKYRYMRCIDTRDWDLIATCFAADASVWYSNGALRRDGRDEIVAFFRNGLGKDHFSSHIALHPEISLLGSGQAEGMWRFQDLVYTTLAADAEAPPHGLHPGQRAEGAGIYYDQYVKTGDEWLIQSTGFVRIYEYWSKPDYPWDDAFDVHADHAPKISRTRGLREV